MKFYLFGGPADGAEVDLDEAQSKMPLIITYEGDLPDAEYVWEPGTNKLRYVQ
jgi:hypothetical protein